ncbi:ankyrin repeat domain-containing protein [Wolbachia endosymbiont of Phyllotreta cruciferae]|uniref:ankyrin repeat domain-containing protein n=1 Tax=Wolbachia endosymbiont of Phyllotreta cruciferae TaxID=2886377 RepID=UPI00209E72ED|nr:ankyrin repeat domain-containing protein [Wolbachia endosymbiont of Phyllotreta cruciferae]
MKVLKLTPLVELILGKGANIEAKDRDSCTPLHYAALGGQLENARFLVDKGANINAICHTDRRKPIHTAAMEGHKNVIEFFISKGINVNDVATGNGWTSLHYAAYYYPQIKT